MARQRIDIGSKWLLHHEGKGALQVGGLTGVQRIEPMPGEIAQSRKYPDGLLRVFLEGDPTPCHALVEVATYPEKRVMRQALGDLTLAYNVPGHVPELLILVLRPRGKFRVGGRHEMRSRLGLSRLAAEWRTVELWKLPAEEFLDRGDVGAMPWVPLMHYDGPPENLLERCAVKIEREAPAKDQADLLAVSQVMTSLRFADPELVQLLGGRRPMIESPLLQQIIAERLHGAILGVLKDRFGGIPREVRKSLHAILDERRLQKLIILAAKCRDLAAFERALRA